MSKTSISGDALAEQVVSLMANGGTLGDACGYNEADYEAVYSLGHGLYRNGRYLDAAKAFGFLVMMSPYERRYVKAYAAALQMLKQYKDAITYYSMAAVMDARDPEPTFYTAECLMAIGMPNEARQALGFVVAQCTQPQQQVLKTRAETLLGLLNRNI